MAELVIFYAISVLMMISAFMVVTRKNAVSSAVFLVATLFLVAAIYALLGADFVAAVQVLVYAGAIMVLFLFVIMILNLDPDADRGPRIPLGELAVMGITAAGFFVIAMMLYFGRQPDVMSGVATDSVIAEAGGNTHVIGSVLFANYFWPFQLTAFLILLAIIASILIAKKVTNASKPSEGL